MKRTGCARHLFGLGEIASERCLAVDRFTLTQRRHNEFVVCGHFDGNSYDVDLIIADHREGIGKPAIGAEGLSRLPGAMLVARCHGRELQAGETLDCRNMRDLRPASVGACTDDSYPNFSSSPAHGSSSPLTAGRATSRAAAP